MAVLRGVKGVINRIKNLTDKLAGTEPLVRVGFLENAKYPDGTPVAMVAAILDSGAPRAHIPPRPFMRNAIAKHKDEWPGAIKVLLKQNNYDSVKTMTMVGAVVAGQIRKEIIATNEPPLSPVTLMLRKMRSDDPNLVVTGKTVGEAAALVSAGVSSGGVSTKPLIWSSHLINSVAYEVKTK